MLTQIEHKSRNFKFGQKGNDVLLNELHQLHTREGLLPKGKTYWHRMTDRRIKISDVYKEKRDDTVKARVCANRRPRWQYTNCITWGHDDVMCYKCQRRQVPHGHRYTRGIHTGRDTRHSKYVTRRNHWLLNLSQVYIGNTFGTTK